MFSFFLFFFLGEGREWVCFVGKLCGGSAMYGLFFFPRAMGMGRDKEIFLFGLECGRFRLRRRGRVVGGCQGSFYPFL